MKLTNEQTWALFWFGIVVALCTLIGSCTIMNNNDETRNAAPHCRAYAERGEVENDSPHLNRM